MKKPGVFTGKDDEIKPGNGFQSEPRIAGKLRYQHKRFGRITCFHLDKTPEIKMDN